MVEAVRMPEPDRLIEMESPTMLRFWTNDVGNSFLVKFKILYDRIMFNETILILISEADLPIAKRTIVLDGVIGMELTWKITVLAKPEYPSIGDIWEYGYENKLKPFFFNLTSLTNNVIEGQYGMIALQIINLILTLNIFIYVWRMRKT